MNHTYSDIYQAAHGQKLSFSDFISDWLIEHDISGDNQREPIIYAIVQTGWEFFEDELIHYFTMRTDLYRLNDDRAVTVLEN
jgi:hypothetical protein